MEVDAKTLRGKGFNPSLTDVPLPFSALLAYLDNLAPTLDHLKVILAPFPLDILKKMSTAHGHLTPGLKLLWNFYQNTIFDQWSCLHLFPPDFVHFINFNVTPSTFYLSNCDNTILYPPFLAIPLKHIIFNNHGIIILPCHPLFSFFPFWIFF